jgi:hypothetical protein
MYPPAIPTMAPIAIGLSQTTQILAMPTIATSALLQERADLPILKEVNLS